MSKIDLPWKKYDKIDGLKQSLIKKLNPEHVKQKWIVLGNFLII